jgi:hypothetical protein
LRNIRRAVTDPDLIANLQQSANLANENCDRAVALAHTAVLPKAHREDADASQAAVLTLVYQALDDIT